MFEGQVDRKAFREVSESTDLRRFRWTDLVAKIAATRDLRDEIDRIDGGFEAFAEARRENDEEGKRVINHDDLSHGKDTVVGLADAANEAVQGEREK